MQGDQAALAELGSPNQQYALGKHVGETQIERLRNARPRRCDQPDQGRIHLTPERIGIAQALGRRDQPRDFLGRVDVRLGPLRGRPERVGRHFVAWILGVQEAGEVHDVAQSDMARRWRGRRACPGHRSGRADMRIAGVDGELRKRPKMPSTRRAT